ncbi:MAG: glycosyltransferase family 2 protein [Desulfobacterales bacterium]|nr:glycosyltransferase family 2 protein [Desulfobacterales bacterium]
MPKTFIIILNWNGWFHTSKCIESLLKSDKINHEIILVDNGSTDQSVSKLNQAYPNITLIQNSTNLGFAEGCNIALRYALSHGGDYFFLLNNDAIVAEDTLIMLLQKAEQKDSADIFAPFIYTLSEPLRIESCGGKIYPMSGRIQHYIIFNQKKPLPKIDFLSGCALWVKRKVVEKIGYLEPRFFCYMEDVDWCIRARKAGFKLAVVPEARVWHKQACATGGKSSPIRIYYCVRNHLLLLNKHYPIHPVFHLFRYFTVVMSYFAFILVYSDMPKKKALSYVIRGIMDYHQNQWGQLSHEI